jgi:SNF2-related domain
MPNFHAFATALVVCILQERKEQGKTVWFNSITNSSTFTWVTATRYSWLHMPARLMLPAVLLVVQWMAEQVDCYCVLACAHTHGLVLQCCSKPQSVRGGILADEMGLGKTLQVTQ